MPGKTNLLNSIKLKIIFKNPLTYNNKYPIKEQRNLTVEKQKITFYQIKIKYHLTSV